MVDVTRGFDHRQGKDRRKRPGSRAGFALYVSSLLYAETEHVNPSRSDVAHV